MPSARPRKWRPAQCYDTSRSVGCYRHIRLRGRARRCRQWQAARQGRSRVAVWQLESLRCAQAKIAPRHEPRGGAARREGHPPVPCGAIPQLWRLHTTHEQRAGGQGKQAGARHHSPVPRGSSTRFAPAKRRNAQSGAIQGQRRPLSSSLCYLREAHAWLRSRLIQTQSRLCFCGSDRRQRVREGQGGSLHSLREESRAVPSFRAWACGCCASVRAQSPAARAPVARHGVQRQRRCASQPAQASEAGDPDPGSAPRLFRAGAGSGGCVRSRGGTCAGERASRCCSINPGGLAA